LVTPDDLRPPGSENPTEKACESPGLPSSDTLRVTPEFLAKVTLESSNHSNARLFDSFGVQPDSQKPIKYSQVFMFPNQESNAFTTNPSQVEISAPYFKPANGPIEYTSLIFNKPKIAAANCYKKSNPGMSRKLFSGESNNMPSNETPNVTEIRLSHPIDDHSPKDYTPESGRPITHNESPGLPRAKLPGRNNNNIPNFPTPNSDSQKILGSYVNASEFGSEYTSTNIRKPRMEPSQESNYDSRNSHEVKNALGN
jgi:hypothetical protein